MEESGHLPPGDQISRAEAVVDRRIATSGNSGGAETVDVAFEYRIVVVDEEVAASVIRQIERAYEERGHLPSGHWVVGAETVVDRRIATSGNSGGAETVDVAFEYRIVVVDEEVAASVIRQIERAYEERGHLPSGHW